MKVHWRAEGWPPLAERERSTVTEPPAGALPDASVKEVCADEFGAEISSSAKMVAQKQGRSEFLVVTAFLSYE